MPGAEPAADWVGTTATGATEQTHGALVDSTDIDETGENEQAGKQAVAAGKGTDAQDKHKA